jgi:LysR family glycine cleavage system transcriptional activator
MPHIPSTQSLRVFQKSAETLSFTQAADELHLTQSAVSHQIRQLEEQLRSPLFVRHRRGISLTGTGQHFFQAVRPILKELEQAIERLQKGGECGPIILRVEPTLLMSGLLPNLCEMLELIPDLRLHVEASDEPPQAPLDDRCIAVYLGHEIAEPSIYCCSVCSEQLLAVCSPSLLLSQPVHTLSDLTYHRLLLVRNGTNEHASDWETWLAPEDRDLLATAQHAIFGTRALALEAALVGQGIALAAAVAAIPHLVSGRLARPIEYCAKCSNVYYFACSRKLVNLPSVRLLRDWILARTTSLNLSGTEKNGSVMEAVGCVPVESPALRCATGL